jgi:Zn ribbon nucleic-acid-binding protein
MKHHEHTLPKPKDGEDPLRGLEAHRARVAHCPVCSAHDHSRVEAFGFDRDGQPVPGWWFCCPRCGTAESQDHVRRWTEAGMAWVRDHADFVGTLHPQKESA